MHPARRQELKQLVEIYALRTRELSDSIAVLGGDVAAGRQIGDIMTEIKRLRGLVEQAATDLFAFVWPQAENTQRADINQWQGEQSIGRGSGSVES